MKTLPNKPKKIETFVKVLLLAFIVSLTSCTSNESQIKELITAKEQRSGRLAASVSLRDFSNTKNSLFTVNYDITTPEQKVYQGSIQIAQTKDEILSKFVWEPSAQK